MIKINKTDAIWLKKAVSKDAARASLNYVQVSDTDRWGHVAAATDGHRLHVVEVPAEIPNGLYKVYAGGELKPSSSIERFIQWPSSVPADKEFVLPCDTLDKAELLNKPPFEALNCYAFGKLFVAKALADDAIYPGLAYRIDAQAKITLPVLMRFCGARHHFALIMPCRPPRG